MPQIFFQINIDDSVSPKDERKCPAHARTKMKKLSHEFLLILLTHLPPRCQAKKNKIKNLRYMRTASYPLRKRGLLSEYIYGHGYISEPVRHNPTPLML